MLIDFQNGELTITRQAELLGINRSSLYYKPVQPSAEEVRIKNLIDEIYTRYPFYGSRRISVELERKGFIVNRKAVQRHMREMGIVAVYPGPNLSRRALQHRIFPYLLRGVTPHRSDHVWGLI